MTIAGLVAGPGATVVAAEFSTVVEAWALTDGVARQLGRFDTVHDDPCRLALAGDPARGAGPRESGGPGLVLVAAAYDRHGVVGYAADSGERLWQRKDLKQCDDVRYAGGDLVVVNIDGRRKHVLDSRTGESVLSLAGMTAMVCHDPDTGRVAWWDSRHRLRVDDPRVGEPAVVPLPPWPQLPPFPSWEALRGDTLVLNASTSASHAHRDGLVWCVDLATSRERWLARISGVLAVHGIRRDGAVLGQADDGDDARLWVADGDGRLTFLPWDRSEAVTHLRDAGLVVTSRRRVLDDTTFAQVATLV